MAVVLWGGTEDIWEAWGSKDSRFIDLAPDPSAWDEKDDGTNEVESVLWVSTGHLVLLGFGVTRMEVKPELPGSRR